MPKTSKVARTIKVKEGELRYKLQSDKGDYIGELVINYDPSRKECLIEISKIAAMDALSIGRR